MHTVRFFASVLATAMLLGLCAILAPSAFELTTAGPQYGIGAGALPQFAIIATVVLSIVMVIDDFAAWRKHGDDGVSTEGEALEGADANRVVIIGACVLALLAAFIALWAYLGFIIASMAFVMALSLLLLPRADWTASKLAIIAAMSVLFPLAVWALFVYVLMVPLR